MDKQTAEALSQALPDVLRYVTSVGHLLNSIESVLVEMERLDMQRSAMYIELRRGYDTAMQMLILTQDKEHNS